MIFEYEPQLSLHIAKFAIAKDRNVPNLTWISLFPRNDESL